MEQDEVGEDLQTNDHFLVKVHGQIETATFAGESFDRLYCKCQFAHGLDWAPVANEETGSKPERVMISQVACKSEDSREVFVWDLPIESTLKSTNPFGWPQLIVSVHGVDNMGNHVPRGYGWAHLPTTPGRHHLCLDLYTPQASSIANRIAGWFIESRRPEFVNSRLAAGSEGRSLVTVESCGHVEITINVIFKDFKKYGFVYR